MRRITGIKIAVLCLMILAGATIQLFSASPIMAATIDDIRVTCDTVTVTGKTESNTSYVRVQVVLASDLNKIVATQTVSTKGHLRSGASYKARLDIRDAHIPDGTLLVIAIGEWDGKRYLQPASIISATCNPSGIVSPTLTPSITPTVDPQFAFPTPTPTDIPHKPVFPVPTVTPTPA